MCIYKRWIVNPYDGKKYLTKCGKCNACLQEKALHHQSRIKNEHLELSDGTRLQCFFVTLTFTNETLPYILRSDYNHFLEEFGRSDCKLKVFRNEQVIDELSYSDFVERGVMFDFKFEQKRPSRLSFIRKKIGKDRFVYIKDRVSIIYRRDIVLFFKRLKKNLFQHGYEGYFSYYYSLEYGFYHRFHAHLLIYFEEGYDSFIKSEIVSAWKYSDLSRPLRQDDGSFREPIEVAVDPAHYVSTYVNLRGKLPRFLRYAGPFKPCCRFSNGFGTHFKAFTFDEVCNVFYRGSLQYPVQKVRDGVSTVEFLRIPKYVLRYHFPYWKGFGKMSTDEIFSVLENPERLKFYCRRLKYELTPDEQDLIFGSHSGGLEYYRIRDFIKRKRFQSVKGLKPGTHEYARRLSDFAYVGSRIFAKYSSESIVRSYDNVTCDLDLFEHFDNIKDFFDGSVVHGLLNSCYDYRLKYELEPNDFKSNVAQHLKLLDIFERSVKHHELKDMYYSKFE